MNYNSQIQFQQMNPMNPPPPQNLVSHPSFQQHAQDPASQGIPSSQTRRGPWSPDEDRRLLDLIALFGPTNWVRISHSLGSRTPKQCRERYHQNLKPSLNRSPITPEEGAYIEKLVAKYGKRWAEIARHLNGRSDNAIKNWWNGGANRRRRASAQASGQAIHLDSKNSSTSLNSVTGADDLDDSDDMAVKSLSALSNPGSSSSLRSMEQQALAGDTHPAQFPQVHQFPQVSFNTSMFGGNAPANNSGPRPSLSSRSTSFDQTTNPHIQHNVSQHPSHPPHHQLPPIINQPPPPILPTKRRILDEGSQPLRRHSAANVLYQIQNQQNNSHSNLSSNTPNSNGNTPFPGSPLSYANSSRNNSISCDFSILSNNPSNPTSATTSRRSSIAPDFFPNPLSASLLHGQTGPVNNHHPFYSPSLLPQRFSISGPSGGFANGSSSTVNLHLPPLSPKSPSGSVQSEKLPPLSINGSSQNLPPLSAPSIGLSQPSSHQSNLFRKDFTFDLNETQNSASTSSFPSTNPSLSTRSSIVSANVIAPLNVAETLKESDAKKGKVSVANLID